MHLFCSSWKFLVAIPSSTIFSENDWNFNYKMLYIITGMKNIITYVWFLLLMERLILPNSKFQSLQNLSKRTQIRIGIFFNWTSAKLLCFLFQRNHGCDFTQCFLQIIFFSSLFGTAAIPCGLVDFFDRIWNQFNIPLYL